MELVPPDLQKLVDEHPAHGERWLEMLEDGKRRFTKGARGTIGQQMLRANQPASLHKHLEFYFRHNLPMVEGDNRAGADLVARWYRRNLQIFSNLHQIGEAGDRILVLYGAAHVPLLKHFAETSPHFCVVDPVPYLADL